MAQQLILVDGSSYLFRAYHALPPLKTTTGHPTGAIFGVLKMLKILYQQYQPDYFAVVFDAKGKTFRHEIYPQYKATRAKADDDLIVQIEPLQNIIRALGFPLLIYPGVEADDVLGTLAKEASKQDIKTIISTGDKDLAQLVNENVSLLNTMNNEALDQAGVKNKFGVTPEQFIDFLTLTGDKSDNIPGVNKVGPVTANKWLAQYGSLDHIIANADSFKGKVGEYLRQAIAENLLLSKKLVTIDCALALEHGINDLQCQPADEQLLLDYYEKFEFKQWAQELSQPKINNIKKETDYQIIVSNKKLDDLLVEIKSQSIASIHFETIAKNNFAQELVGIAISTKPGVAYYIPLAHDNPEDSLISQQLDCGQVLAKLKPIFEDDKITIVAHGIKLYLNLLKQYQIKLLAKTCDTSLQSYVLNSVSSRHGLAELAKIYLHFNTIDLSQLLGTGRNKIAFCALEIEQAANYCCQCADINLSLNQFFNVEIEPQSKIEYVYKNIELPLIPVLAQIEQNGVLVDAQKLSGLSQELGTQIEAIESKAYELAGAKFNLASPKQIQEILYNQQQLPIIKKTPKGQPSTAEAVLSQLAQYYELPRLLLEHRSLSKLKTTYTDSLPKEINPTTGRIHTSYQQVVTATGRLSSIHPNLQNIPIRTENGRKIRHSFIAEAGKLLLAADYSQIELRIMAHLSEDDSLLNAFRNNIDVHSHTAAEIFSCSVAEIDQEQRRHAKAINFGLIYGMSAFGLANQLKISQKKSQDYIDRYFTRYPGVKEYMEITKQFAKENGFVETIFGRRLYLPEINSRNAHRRQYAQRTAINAPMQGTAADLIKLAMIEVATKIEKSNAMMIMQVHDELVLEVKADEIEPVREIVASTMKNIASLKVPLVVDTGVADNWDDAH